MEKVITVIDIGTTKFLGLVAVVEGDYIEVKSVDVKQTEEGWVKGGRIVDIEGATTGLIDLVESLKKQSKEKIEWIIVGVGGGHIKGTIYSKTIEIVPKGREINKTDIQIIEREIKNAVIPTLENNKDIIFIIPQEYIIDNTPIPIEKSPIGMHGNLLEMKAHVVSGETNPIKDIHKCANMAGLKVEPHLFPYSWAVSEAVINEEEKKLGCLVIDFGKDTIDFVCYIDGKIILTESLRLGSSLIDSDISRVFHTPLDFAEELKKKYANCYYKKLIEENPEAVKTKKIEIYDPSGKFSKKVSIEEISDVVYFRLKEILEYIWKKIQKNLMELGINPFIKISEVVISGGGSKLEGIEFVAESIFQIPVRIGLPQKIFNLDRNYQTPEFAAALGLLLLGSKIVKREDKNFIRKFKKWVIDLFFPS
jgi:cell division protein FtsA